MLGFNRIMVVKKDRLGIINKLVKSKISNHEEVNRNNNWSLVRSFIQLNYLQGH
jgi:hypothetical protein